MRRLMLGFLIVLGGCDGETTADAGGGDAAGGDAGDQADAGAGADGGGLDAGADGGPGVDAGPSGPNVDRTDPQLYTFELSPTDADPASGDADQTQLGQLDTRAEPRGLLVVYLHGANRPSTCGSRAHGEVLAGLGFHVLAPCYESDYGIGNCDDRVGDCRLEAFEGVDHHPFVNVAVEDSLERRVARALAYLDTEHPGGDWAYYLGDADTPAWERIIISGISHGASTSALIGKVRSVARVVSLSGANDRGQAWLSMSGMTPVDRYWSFSHTDDGQHPAIQTSQETLGLTGPPADVDRMSAPYGGSHRLFSGAPSSNGHTATQAGGSSPMSGGAYDYLPVWRTMYGAD